MKVKVPKISNKSRYDNAEKVNFYQNTIEIEQKQEQEQKREQKRQEQQCRNRETVTKSQRKKAESQKTENGLSSAKNGEERKFSSYKQISKRSTMLEKKESIELQRKEQPKEEEEEKKPSAYIPLSKRR